jgi:hypothetical protein
VWDSATRRVRVASRPDGSGKRRHSFDDVVVVVCFLTLIVIVVIGGVLMLFSWVVANLAVSPRIACPQFDGCVVAAPNEDPAVLRDDHPTAGPRLTR